MFISSDSIYDVCDGKARDGGLIREEFDSRPEEGEIRRKMIKNDEYGHVRQMFLGSVREHSNRGS